MPDQSMHPEIQKGDKVGCRTVEKDAPVMSGHYYHIRMKYGAMVRKIYLEGEKYRLDAHNDQFPPISITISEVMEVASVVWLLRDYV